jgi:glycosyltransferase involved in cell wall biosynthesis
MVPYGADPLPRGLPVPELPTAVALRPDAFALYVSRWERENNPLLVAEAHRASGVGLPLVMLGKATYDDELEAGVREAAASNAVLPGPVFGDGYRGLQANARCYIHATEVGGTHPALIEALGAGNLCLVLDTPENREVAGGVSWFFADATELAALLVRVTDLGSSELHDLRQRARAFAADRYSWPVVCGRYLALLTGSPPTPVAEPTPASSRR